MCKSVFSQPGFFTFDEANIWVFALGTLPPMAERTAKLARQFSDVTGQREGEDQRTAKKRVESIAPAAKHLLTLDIIPKAFSSFMKASEVRVQIAGGADKCFDPNKALMEQSGDLTLMMLSPSGRSSTLSKAEAPPTLTNAPIPDPSAVPRAPPTAAPPGMLDGARKSLDIRSINLTAYAMVNAEWYYQKAQAALEASKAGGTGTQRLGLYPIDPYECTKEHVQWNLTVAHGPFEECMLKDHCMGRSMVEQPHALSFAIKQYISPGTREEWERTGVKPGLNEHGQVHSPFCILDLLAFTSTVADLNAANHESSGVCFPPFYNTAGRSGGYSPSALCGFSTHKLSGVTRAFRKFAPGQFTVGKLTIPVYSRGQTTQEELDALIEIDSMVGWKPEFETDSKRVMWMVTPAPYEAPLTAPNRAPKATESHPAVSTLVPTPDPTVDPRQREGEARRGVTHILPRLPAPINVAATNAIGHAPAPVAPPPTRRKKGKAKPAAAAATTGIAEHDLTAIKDMLSGLLGHRVKIVPEN